MLAGRCCMRKKSIFYLFDTGFWFFVSVLPLIVFLVMLWHNGATGITLIDCFNACNLNIVTDNIVYTSLISLFGSDGVFPMFSSPDILVYFTYLVLINICHLVVDILLFIPRYAHKLMDCFGGVKYE